MHALHRFRGALGSALALAFLAAPLHAGTKGDVDASGAIDAGDVVKLRQILREGAPAPDPVAADVAPIGGPENGLDSADASVLMRGLAGENLDGDDIDARAEIDTGSSPFLDDALADGDLDTLANYLEAALGSRADQADGIGGDDASFYANPNVTTGGPVIVLYTNGVAPETLGRLEPLRRFLIDNGYEVVDAAVPPPPTPCTISDPACVAYLDPLSLADAIIVPETQTTMPAIEVENLLAFVHNRIPLPVSTYPGYVTPLLVLTEPSLRSASFGVQQTHSLADTILGDGPPATPPPPRFVFHGAPSCPSPFDVCPLGWSTFRPSDGTLDASHPLVQGATPAESVAALTTFLGDSLLPPPPSQRSAPDPSFPTAFDQVATLGPDAWLRDATGVIGSAQGLAQVVAVEVPYGLCQVDPWRALVVSDLEAFSALVGADGDRRGMNAVDPSTNQRFVRNAFQWLLWQLDPVPPTLPPLHPANRRCPLASQGLDPSYAPQIANPKGLGRRVVVDRSHSNAHTVTGGLKLYDGFARLLTADGYVVSESTMEFLDPSFPSFLDTIDVLVLTTPNETVTEAELEPVRDWIANRGGSLLLVFDHQPWPENLRIAAASKLGVLMPDPSLVPLCCNNGSVIEPVHTAPYTSWTIQNPYFALTPPAEAAGAIIAGHPIVSGENGDNPVDGVRLFHGTPFQVTPTSISTPILVAPNVAVFQGSNASAAGYLYAAALELGSGRVFVIGEAAAFTAQLDTFGNDRWGMNTQPANEQLLRNVMHWLDGTP